MAAQREAEAEVNVSPDAVELAATENVPHADGQAKAAAAAAAAGCPAGFRERETSERGAKARKSRASSKPGSAYQARLTDEEAQRYATLGEHARGGLGRVIRARDDRLGRVVAIKELLRSSSFAESLFMREALITARLQHPGIVPVHEAGRWPSGEPFYVMKLVAGRSLQEIIQEARDTRERLAYLRNVLAVVETIAYAHSEGVLHRDIKPANIIIGDYGETVVVDWGLARDDKQPLPIMHSVPQSDGQSLASDTPGDATTRATAGTRSSPPAAQTAGSSVRWMVSGNYSVSGKVIGTPAYMAPEQAAGKEVDERADIYALGAMLYELLAGAAPYPGKQLQVVLDRVLCGPPEPLAERARDIPPELVTIVEKAMARDPAHRYASVKELAEELERFQNGKLVAAHAYTSFALVRRWLWRHRSPVLVALASAVVLVVMAVLGVDRIIDERNEAQRQRSQARAAQASAEKRNSELLLLQAASALERDPTATVAWLAKTSLTGAGFRDARRYFEEALALGVARHVITHDNAATAVAFLGDGKELLSAGRDGILRLIDVDSGRERIIAKTSEPFLYLMVSPDDRWVAATGETGEVYLWDFAAANRALRVLPGKSAMVISHRYLTGADGDVRLFVRYGDGAAAIWPTRAEEPESHLDGVAAVTADARRLVRRDDKGVTLVDAATGKELWRTALPSAYERIALSPDDRHLAIITRGGPITIVDMATGAVKPMPIRAMLDVFMPLVFSASGRWLATAGYNSTIELLDVESGKARTLWGHQNGIYAIAFTPDETTLLSASDDGTARVWDLESQNVRVLHGHKDDVFGVAVSRDMIATASFDGSIRIWPLEVADVITLRDSMDPPLGVSFLSSDVLLSIASSGELRRFSVSDGKSEIVRPGQPDNVVRKSLLADQRSVAVVASNSAKKLEVWDLRTGRGMALAFSAGWPGRLAFSRQASRGVISSMRGDVFVWDMPRDGGEIALSAFTGEDGEPVVACDVELAPDGASLAVVDQDRITLWDVATGKRRDTVELPHGARGCDQARRVRAVFGPDGAWLAVTGAMRDVFMWNVRTGASHTFDTGGQKVFRIAFAPDGHRLAGSFFDRTTYLFDGATGHASRLGRHNDLVWDLAFSPDGMSLATASYDQTIKLWDLAHHDVRTLHGHSGAVQDVAFSPDGARLASASDDGTIRLWNLRASAIRDAQALTARIERATTAVIQLDGVPRTPR